MLKIITLIIAAGWLLATISEALVPQQSISLSSSSSSSTSFIRLRANKLRRPDLCREQLPRKPEDLPALVITGKVREVYLAGGSSDNGTQAPSEQQQPQPANKALVQIGRVIKGNQQLLGSDIIVSGFNSSNSVPCPNYVKQNDSLILLLNHEGDKRYSIQGNNILSMSLVNLDRVNALASDEPFKRRPPIEDILCEAHYCAYGRCAIHANGQQVSCQCPDGCPSIPPAPVCGSDNVTYANECHLIREGCRLKRPLFVVREASC